MLIDDHALCRNGLADLLRARGGMEVLAAVFRGPAGTLFTRAGTATHQASLWVPDRTLSFAVTVRP